MTDTFDNGWPKPTCMTVEADGTLTIDWFCAGHHVSFDWNPKEGVTATHTQTNHQAVDRSFTAARSIDNRLRRHFTPDAPPKTLEPTKTLETRNYCSKCAFGGGGGENVCVRDWSWDMKPYKSAVPCQKCGADAAKTHLFEKETP